ncbi:MAG: glutaredoxin family protein [Ignavibacteria bacterium]|nr:glutaredoxin family protein [Ignavibacteria bacterium]
MIELQIYSKKNCHLCEEMKIVLINVSNEYEFDLKETDIESDPVLNLKYKDKIPVLLVNGKLFAKYRVSEVKLKEKLKSIRL